MKKLLSVMLSAIMLTMSATVAMAAETDYTISSRSVIVRGDINNADGLSKQVTLIVVDNTDETVTEDKNKVVYIDQTNTNGTGEYSFSFKVPETKTKIATYDIRVNEDGKLVANFNMVIHGENVVLNQSEVQYKQADQLLRFKQLIGIGTNINAEEYGFYAVNFNATEEGNNDVPHTNDVWYGSDSVKSQKIPMIEVGGSAYATLTGTDQADKIYYYDFKINEEWFATASTLYLDFYLVPYAVSGNTGMTYWGTPITYNTPITQ